MTIPSDPAKNASTRPMKCFSGSVSFFQSAMSLEKSISSGVQKTATLCLYMRYRCCSDDLIGNRVNAITVYSDYCLNEKVWILHNE